ncbi:MAG: class I SAM-dependent methyltransferase [Verrucomicrobiaceae bacterium]|nr:MAG: class I SAM-dependent methyltransferase [Verrucomicrobiaceae bacterium]
MQKWPALSRISAAVLDDWPQHEKFLSRSLGAHSDADLNILESYAADILQLIGANLETHCRHYHWLCVEFTKEAMHFLRTGEYRCKTFAEADAQVYSNRPFMMKYMDGLLVSQALWANHAKCAIYFRDKFLPRLKENARYLEIGPGHGLFLAQAARLPANVRATAWDVSAESVDQTRAAMETVGVKRSLNISQRNVLTAGDYADRFDAIVISEVLEHMEDPIAALKALRTVIAEDGELLVNVPVNSPAPDHIYLLRLPEEAVRLVEAGGFEVIDHTPYPMTGYSLDQAVKDRATISCMLIARPRR